MKKDNLFLIGQVAKCCGVSRSTILRLEDRGILTPAYTEKNLNGGIRYYDNYNVSQILQVRKLLDLGLSYDEIKEYYVSDGASPTLLDGFMDKLQLVKRMFEEMTIRLNNKNDMRFEIINLPEYVCFVREYTGTPREKINAMESLFHEACEKGYRFLPTEPLFIINKCSDFLNGGFNFDLVHSYKCCIPLEPETAPADAVKISACRAVSMLYYGDYSDLDDAYVTLSEKINEMGITPKGDVRALAIVAPYVGKNINPKNYVSRLVVPFE